VRQRRRKQIDKMIDDDVVDEPSALEAESRKRDVVQANGIE